MQLLTTNLLKFVNKQLTPAEKETLIRDQAKELGLDAIVLTAIIETESSGKGFYGEGSKYSNKCLVRFEPDYFEKFAGEKAFFIPLSVSSQEAKGNKEFTGREAYEKALIQSPGSAIKATSFGLGQIMGFNYERVGFLTLRGFADTMEVNEYEQILALINFITADKLLVEAIRNKNFDVIAGLYNGEKQATYYANKLKTNYIQLSQKQGKSIQA